MGYKATEAQKKIFDFVERTESGNIHITARIGGRDVKYVVTSKKALYQEILQAGFNAMPDREKEAIAAKYLLSAVQKTI